jgi:hypothetical protein
MGRQEKSESKGSNAPLLLVVLLLLVGLSAWNYRRNAALESDATSPYATLSDRDLDVLIAAYRSEIQAMQGGGSGRAVVRDTNALHRGVREFERVQRASRSVREAGYELAEREGAVQALEQEKARRTGQAGGVWLTILRRAFTVSL